MSLWGWREIPRPTKIHYIEIEVLSNLIGNFWCQTGLPQLFQPLHQCPNWEYKEAWLRSEIWWIDPNHLQVCWWRCPHGWNRKGPPIDGSMHFTSGVNTGYSASILAKQNWSLQTKFPALNLFWIECGPSEIKIVLWWIWLDKQLDYQSCATALAESASQEESLQGVWG